MRLLGAVEDPDPPPPLIGPDADDVDDPVADRIDLDDVFLALGQHRHDIRVNAPPDPIRARALAPRVFGAVADEHHGRLHRGELAAEPGRADEQQRVRKPVAVPRRRDPNQRRLDQLPPPLPVENGLRPPELGRVAHSSSGGSTATSRSKTVSGAPAASTTRTRSGKSSASRRNPSRTRR